MQVSSNPKSQSEFVTMFAFANGWAASIALMGHGLASCCAMPGKKAFTIDDMRLGPQEAFDEEVVAWLVEVMTYPPIAT